MNERIKELAWSIGIADKNLQGQIDTDWNQIEKFAELIVRECALVAGIMEHEGRAGIGRQILDSFEVQQ
jgi:hypothetical protein